MLSNDTDPDDDAISAALVSGPANGTLILNADGAFRYTPHPGSGGFDAFTYSVSDGRLTDTATVTVRVAPAATTTTTTTTTTAPAT